LEEGELIQREKENTEKAQESFISSKPLKKETIYYELYLELKEDYKVS